MKNLEGFCEGNIVVEFITEEQQSDSGLKETREQAGNYFASRMARKGGEGKENKGSHNNNHNQDYKNLMKRSE